MTLSEENYLKAVYNLQKHYKKGVPTNAIAEEMATKASSVSDMIKRLAEKKLLFYKKYQGAKLSESGEAHAIKVIRKHRLWETFLVEKLNFSWDEVHDIAEQLEHIESEKLIKELDKLLGYPKVDPHGDPIPDEQGNVIAVEKRLLSEFNKGEQGICVGVNDSSSSFLQYLDKHQISLGKIIVVKDKEEFDGSMQLQVSEKQFSISQLAANNIYLKSLKE
ncbi:metal-dependent transcriptional regulator [Mesonia aestuariivivens]|uniref:Transcriptional regulator MntR n=1 Tax=Mesonia aestuariivivens TaxID=2796128 RepID=A0ABS6W1F0_9FLAO|nr:metal-dependent transcriptional regulator [Mesonia aestuariivivens]MBW2961685.1 metal-dependent transcriptional regulator [Mesonia aestuariivivens]